MESMFDKCFKEILKHEGGLSKDKRDPGGTTNWGISLRYLQSMGLDLNQDGVVDEQDVISLEKEGAKDIYYKYWWQYYDYKRFSNINIVEKVFDLAVNMGGYRSHKLLQIAINRLSDKPIAVDGILGDQTFGAANFKDPYELRQELRNCAKHRYIEILANHPNMEWARNGWMNRAAW